MTIILSGLVGGMAGALLSSCLYVRHENRAMKRDTLRQLVAYRFDVSGEEFSRTLNEIIVMFAGSKEVIQTVEEFTQERTNDNLLELFRKMADDVGIDHSHVSRGLFLTAFNTRPSAEQKR